MRNTESAGKTFSTMALSSRADVRSCPNGFSMTTRRHEPACGVDRPERSSCSQTVAKNDGGIDR